VRMEAPPNAGSEAPDRVGPARDRAGPAPDRFEGGNSPVPLQTEPVREWTGLIRSRKEERYVYYSVKPETASELVRLLTACC